MKIQLLNALILSALLGISGCEAPAGDVGPQGAAGIAGEKGDKGPTGDKGAFSGYASDWRVIDVPNWKLTGFKAVVTQTDAQLTQAILDQGLILAYYRRNAPFLDNTAVFPMPDETNEFLFTFKANVGSMDYELFFKQSEPVSPSIFLFWQIKVRYVIVPAAKSGRLANVNWKDYNEVKKALNLND